MEPLVVFLIALGIWLLIGLVISFVMGRRGHNPFGWWFLGAVFGPLAIILAWDAARRRAPVSEIHDPGETAGGSVDVLVGVDGSTHSGAAVTSIQRLLGPRLRRLAFAGVISYEGAERGGEEREEALRNLKEAAGSVAGLKPETVVLVGAPSAALVEYGEKEGFDLLAVGARGRGASKAVMGSVSSRLVRQSKLPVLIAGAD